jgi:predicted RNA-binding Zn-ribbon protein involved in translation (DUF1610 family)
MLDMIWDHGYSWTNNKNEKVIFNPDKNLLEHPKFIDYNQFKIKTKLSARALSSLSTQLCAILGSSVEKQRKRLYILNKLKKDKIKPNKIFFRALRRNKPKKPRVENINPELSSKCCDIQFVDNKFNAFIQLKCIGKSFGNIRIPIQYTCHSLKLKGNLKNSFLFKNKSIDLRWENEVEKRNNGIVVGADQGKLDILTLSNNEVTPAEDMHHWTLSKIIDKMARKKKGSKSFKKASDHRTNFINWSINYLNFSNVKEVRLEEIWNINYKKLNVPRKLKHWSNVLIRDKVFSRCETLGVHVVEQSSPYRSQRCSCCGLVRKANRKGKIYTCKSCGFVCDADLNAAINHEQNLPPIPNALRKQKLNFGHGFYWKSNGLFLIDGSELRVPDAS